MSLDRCRVVLVEPRIAANLGATARVMHNFGLKDLVLVAPQADPNDREAIGPMLSTASVARTLKVWAPSLRPENVVGEAHVT